MSSSMFFLGIFGDFPSHLAELGAGRSRKVHQGIRLKICPWMDNNKDGEFTGDLSVTV